MKGSLSLVVISLLAAVACSDSGKSDTSTPASGGSGGGAGTSSGSGAGGGNASGAPVGGDMTGEAGGDAAGGAGVGGDATGPDGVGGDATGGDATGAGGVDASAGAGGAEMGGTGGAGGAGGAGGTDACESPTACAAAWEDKAATRYDALLAGDTGAFKAFLKAVPKGGDLHQHLSGSVYAETYLAWALADGLCINSTTHVALASCGAATSLPVPTSGSFYDDIVRAWSMQDFVVGTESGHDHFFATFGKFGLVSGTHFADSLADVVTRAASENQVYVETSSNLGRSVGSLAAATWSGIVTADALPAFYDEVLAAPGFAAALDKDVAAVTLLRTQYRTALGCSAANPPAACDVGVRFIAQVARTGAVDQIFGQLLSAYEMAALAPDLVAVNLSSPEDDTSALNNYGLQLQMLDFLHGKYTATAASPLHVTLSAGELSGALLPSGYEGALKSHVHDAVVTGHAERISHGVDILGEDNADALLTDMSSRGVLVEVCLSSNAQTLDVSGAAHPLAAYIDAHVPVALATESQGVSRSSLAGEYFLAATEQHLGYRQLKRMARDSLEHAFLPGDSLWSSLANATAVAACAPTQSTGLGDPANPACQQFLDDSERARTQWELERRFRAFESQQ